jgi:hypothetical protein
VIRAFRRAAPYTILQVIAAILGIAGFFVSVTGDLSKGERMVVGIVAVVAVAVICITALLARQKPLQPITREEMEATGERLLAHDVHDSVVWFAGDLSWAPYYEQSIARAVNQGKSVTILYPENKREAAKDNAERLKKTNATIHCVPADTKLRAMLVDHDDPDNAILYVVNRVSGGHGPQINTQSADLSFEGKIYRWKHDSILIRTATKLYEVLAP